MADPFDDDILSDLKIFTAQTRQRSRVLCMIFSYSSPAARICTVISERD
jgi:hypothetical protein